MLFIHGVFTAPHDSVVVVWLVLECLEGRRVHPQPCAMSMSSQLEPEPRAASARSRSPRPVDAAVYAAEPLLARPTWRVGKVLVTSCRHAG